MPKLPICAVCAAAIATALAEGQMTVVNMANRTDFKR